MHPTVVPCALALVALSSVPAAAADLIASSNFDSGAQGWQLPASTQWEAVGGNPGGYLLGAIEESSNATSVASAPAAYLGSWRALECAGWLRFDYRRFSNGSGTISQFLPLTVKIRGGTDNPNGEATWTGPIITAPTQWLSFYVPIAFAAGWSVSAGSWSDILTNVTSLTIQIELVANSGASDDKAGLDNVILERIGDPPNGDFNGDGVVDGADLGMLLDAWGGPLADLNCDDMTDGSDLGILLSQWTPGPT